MRLKEQRLWDTMKRNAPPDVWIQRVENLVVAGMPDLFVAGPSRTSWVELKAPTRPKRETTPLLGNKEGLNADQINWHLKAATRAVRSYVLIRDSAQQLYLVPGAHAREINHWTRHTLVLFSAADYWPDIFVEIC